MIVIDLIIPEANDSQSVRLQPGLPFSVGLLSAQVGLAVDFQHQRRLRTIEVDNVRAEEVLAAKLEAIQMAWQEEYQDRQG